jgi:hypothetical protein
MEQNLYSDKSFALSQSALKDWKTMPPNIWFEQWVLGKRKFKGKRTMDFGSLLDTVCFNPELFDKRFLVAECKRPSEKVELILNDIYTHLNELNSNIKELNKKDGTKVPLKKITLVDNDDIIKKFCLSNKYYESKPDLAVKMLLKDGKEYFEFLKTVGKRVAITEAQKTLAEELKEKLFTDPETKYFFIQRKNTTLIFQNQIRAEFPIEGIENVEVIPVKGILDITMFNHTKKTVREIDLKYTDDVFNFNSYQGPVKLFDYGTQHSFYYFLLSEWLKVYEDGKYADYQIVNPLNVVIDEKIKVPYIYKYDFDDLHIKKMGIEGTPIKGWSDMLHEIAWHLNKNDWTRPREHLTQGSISIKLFSKK